MSGRATYTYSTGPNWPDRITHILVCLTLESREQERQDVSYQVSILTILTLIISAKHTVDSRK